MADHGGLGAHEFKVPQMEQQVEVLRLEKELNATWRILGQMRAIEPTRRFVCIWAVDTFYSICVIYIQLTPKRPMLHSKYPVTSASW